MLGLQSDFAMLFAGDTSGSGDASRAQYTFWLGKVQRLIKKVGKGKVDYREPVDLDDCADGTVFVVAYWYKLVRPSSTSGVDSVYTLTEPDHKPYNVAHILAPVSLSVNRIRLTTSTQADGKQVVFEYELSTHDRQAIDVAIAEIERAGAGSAVHSFAQSRKRQSAQQLPDEGRVISTRTTGSGRVSKHVQYTN
jgi:hypothetical protein